MKTLIGNVELETNFDGDLVFGVDVRVYHWLEQWLSADEARALVYSLAAKRLVQLIVANRKAIEATPVWT